MSFVNFIRIAIASVVLAFLAGCAHPIAVSAEKTPERVESNLIQKKVAYTMSDAERSKQVTTEGGGGDRVSYYPYRDLEKAIRDALRAVYSEVIVLRSAADAKALSESGAALVFSPEIVTTSGSSSPFTWPPTRFTTEISCKVTDASGTEVTRFLVKGSGNAEFSEFVKNFGLAASRAGTDAAEKLTAEVKGNEKLR